MSFIIDPYRFATGGGGGCSLLSTAPTSNLEFAFVGECLVGNDGDGVTSWTDSSPVGNDLTETNQTGGPYQKQTSEINGLSVIRSVGSAEWSLDTPLTISSFSYVAVLKPDSATGIHVIICGNTGSPQIMFSSGKLTVTKAGIVVLGSANTTISTSSFSTIGVTYDGSTLRFYLNGATDGVVSVSQTFTANLTTAFIDKGTGTANWGGDIAEQLFWSAVINESTHLLNSGGGVTDELRTKYAHY